MAAPVAERLERPAAPRLVQAVSLAVASGALIAVQQRANGGLAERLGDPVLAATVSFGSGLLLMTTIVATRASSRRALPVLRTLPGWTLLGGLGGATLVGVGAVAAPEIGVALLTVAIVGGQTVGALAVDGVGMGPGGRRPLTAARGLGAALCLVAIAISVGGGPARPNLLLLLAVVAAGALGALQQALNGRLRQAVGDTAVATFVNFVVGTTALAVALGLREVVVGVQARQWPGSWIFYTGGVLGAVFVAVAAVLVRPLGVLRLGLCLTAGQLLGAVVLDATVPERGHGVAAATAVAAGLTLLAVFVSGRRRR